MSPVLGERARNVPPHKHWRGRYWLIIEYESVR
jgi:hypothetical protein